MGRWQLHPGQVAGIEVTRESLVRFLEDTFQFSNRRATAEIDEFLGALEQKLRRATESATQERPAENSKLFRPTSAA
jgi:hypothetical protein